MSVDTLARILVGWCVLSIIVVGAYAVAMALHKSRAARRAETVNWIPTLPPVPWPMKRPPVTQADVDSTWLEAWADERSDIDDMEQSIFDRLFRDQIAAEGLQ